MSKSTLRPILLLAGGILGGWFAIRYALPVLFPFLLGAGLAFAAEPMVGLLDRRLGLKRWLSSAVGVSGVFLLLVALLILATALLVRQAGRLTGLVPELAEGVRVGMGSLEAWLLTAASGAPKAIQPVLVNGVTGFFSDGSAMLEQVAGKVPGVLSRFFGHVTSGFLTLATAVLAAFMISAKLPRLKAAVRSRVPEVWRQRYVPALKGLRRAVVGWLMAQLKLTAVVGAVLLGAFWLLKIPHSVLWAGIIALVDALPVLGCGVVLVPWGLICLVRGERLLCLGLLGTYALVWLLRSVLEPKLLGKELGLDPLVTLLAIYTGYRLLGLAGMLLAPLVALVLTKAASTLANQGNFGPNPP